MEAVATLTPSRPGPTPVPMHHVVVQPVPVPAPDQRTRTEPAATAVDDPALCKGATAALVAFFFLLFVLVALIAFVVALPMPKVGTRTSAGGAVLEAGRDLGATELGAPVGLAPVGGTPIAPVTAGPIGAPVATTPPLVTPAGDTTPTRSSSASSSASSRDSSRDPSSPATAGPPPVAGVPVPTTRPASPTTTKPQTPSSTSPPTTAGPVLLAGSFSVGARSGGTGNPATTGWTYRRGDGEQADPSQWVQLDSWNPDTRTWSCAQACGRHFPNLVLPADADTVVTHPSDEAIALTWRSPSAGRASIRGSILGSDAKGCGGSWSLRVGVSEVALGRSDGTSRTIGPEAGTTVQLAKGDPVVLVLTADGPGTDCAGSSVALGVVGR